MVPNAQEVTYRLEGRLWSQLRVSAPGSTEFFMNLTPGQPCQVGTVCRYSNSAQDPGNLSNSLPALGVQSHLWGPYLGAGAETQPAAPVRHGGNL